MAVFGDVKGTLTGGATAIPAGGAMATTAGSISVEAGDLIVAAFAELGGPTVASCTDNLGHTYTAQDAGLLSTVSGRVYWVIATVTGTLTTVTGTGTASANDFAVVAAVFAGFFTASPLDVHPTTIADAATPYAAPATGTLAQASELVVCSLSLTRGQTNTTATSPLLLAGGVSATSTTANTANSVSACIGSKVVTVTTTTSPAFATTSGTINGGVVTTISFREGTIPIRATPAGSGALTVQSSALHIGTATLAGAGALAANAILLTTLSPFDWYDDWPTPTLRPKSLPVALRPYATPFKASPFTYLISTTLSGTGSLVVDGTVPQPVIGTIPWDPGWAVPIRPPKSLPIALRPYFVGFAIASEDYLEATLAGSGNLSTDATVVSAGGGTIVNATATFAGSGSLTIQSSALHIGTATFAGSGSLFVNSSALHVATATLSGSGSLTVDSSALHIGTATFVGAGALFVNAQPVAHAASASFAGVGTLLVDSSALHIGTATFSGAGSLSADAQIRGTLFGSFSGVGAGTLSVSASQIWKTNPVGFAGAGTFSGSSLETELGTATLAGAGALFVNAQPVAHVASASFAGAGNLLVDSSALHIGTATLSGAGTLFANASPVAHAATATLSGAGNFLVDSSALHVATAMLSGAGSLTADAQLKGTVFGSFSGVGAGTLSVNASQIWRTNPVGFAGLGTLSGSSLEWGSATATLAGAGSLSADAQIRGTLFGSFSGVGAGTLSVNSSASHVGTATLAGSGNLLVDSSASHVGRATLAGAGTLSADAVISALSIPAVTTWWIPWAAPTRPQKFQQTSLKPSFGGFVIDGIVYPIRATFAGSGTLVPPVATGGAGAPPDPNQWFVPWAAPVRPRKDLPVALRRYFGSFKVPAAQIAAPLNTWFSQWASPQYPNANIGINTWLTSVSQLIQTIAVFSGSGNLTVNAAVRSLATARLNGSGSLNVQGQVRFTTTATLGGSGSIFAIATGGTTAFDAGLSWFAPWNDPVRPRKDLPVALRRYFFPFKVIRGSQMMSATLAGSGAFGAFGRVPGQLPDSSPSHWFQQWTPPQYPNANYAVITFLTSVNSPGITSISATFAGSGALTVNATIKAQARATLAGSGALVANATRSVPATATMAGSGALAVSAFRQTPATATLSGSGTLLVTTSARLSGTATLAGSGTLVAPALLRTQASAIFAGNSNFIASPAVLSVFTTAYFDGRGGLSTPAFIITYGTSVLAGSGSLNVDAVVQKFASATLAGAGNLSGNAVRQSAISATLAGAGTLSVDATQVSTLSLSATLSGIGTLTVDATRINVQNVSATLSGSGTFVADCQRLTNARAILAGSGLLVTRGSLSLPMVPAPFIGAGTLRVDAQNYNQIIVSGEGGLTAKTTQIIRGAGNFFGAGLLRADGLPQQFGSAGLTGSGSLSFFFTELGAATLTGIGTLQVQSSNYIFARVNLTGAGSLRAEVQGFQPGGALLAGSGSLSVSATILAAAGVTLSGVGSLNVRGTMIHLVPFTELDGDGTLIGDAWPSYLFLQANLDGQGNLRVAANENYRALAVLHGEGFIDVSFERILGILVTKVIVYDEAVSGVNVADAVATGIRVKDQ